jgi:hypothetical protein
LGEALRFIPRIWLELLAWAGLGDACGCCLYTAMISRNLLQMDEVEFQEHYLAHPSPTLLLGWLASLGSIHNVVTRMKAFPTCIDFSRTFFT